MCIQFYPAFAEAFTNETVFHILLGASDDNLNHVVNMFITLSKFIQLATDLYRSMTMFILPNLITVRGQVR
jgi:hypothetical protein